MDKTTQDSLAKKPVDMRDRILEHLEALTSAVSLDDLARLSTSDIAETPSSPGAWRASTSTTLFAPVLWLRWRAGLSVIFIAARSRSVFR